MDTHVDFDGKPIAEESYNEITKMLYRIKDFEQVYNISENKFKSRGEDNIDIRKSIETVVEVAQNDL